VADPFVDGRRRINTDTTTKYRFPDPARAWRSEPQARAGSRWFPPGSGDHRVQRL